jgi:hypothetical protein
MPNRPNQAVPVSWEDVRNGDGIAVEHYAPPLPVYIPFILLAKRV